MPDETRRFQCRILAPRAEAAPEEEKLSIVGRLLRDLKLDRERKEREIEEAEKRVAAEAAAKADSNAVAAPPTPESGTPQPALSLPKSPAHENVSERPNAPTRPTKSSPQSKPQKTQNYPTHTQKTSRNECAFPSASIQSQCNWKNQPKS